MDGRQQQNDDLTDRAVGKVESAPVETATVVRQTPVAQPVEASGDKTQSMQVADPGIESSPSPATETEPLLEDSWPLDVLVSLLDSAREETRAYRTQMYGSLAAAFLIPLATITLQNTEFVDLLRGWFGYIIGLMWLVGIGFFMGGLSYLAPRPSLKWNESTEGMIMKNIQVALNSPARARALKKCIKDQHMIFEKVGKAARPFFWAMLFFLLCAAMEFGGFIFIRLLSTSAPH